MAAQRLRLRPRCDKRLRNGHLWIYSNEIDTAVTPLKGVAAGAAMVLENSQGEAMGLVLTSPANLICARLVSHDASATIDQAFFVERFERALALRQQFYDQPYYRLAYGESDGLPGVVVDRFGDYLVVQLATPGMEQRRDSLVAALVERFEPAGVLLKNDGGARKAEGLPSYVEVVHGEVPDCIRVFENGTSFDISPHTGQKTGWFYDHRESRALLSPLCAGARVLDVFSYVGGWGVQAATAGAERVLCLDSSAPALELAMRNSTLNGCDSKFDTLCSQAEPGLRDLARQGQEFDIVIMDPPAFIKRRKDSGAGQAAYRKLNHLALGVLARGGLLVSASCSMHLSRESLVDVVSRACSRAGRSGLIVAQGGQGPDHPIMPAIPETEYLKTVFCRLQD